MELPHLVSVPSHESAMSAGRVGMYMASTNDRAAEIWRQCLAQQSRMLRTRSIDIFVRRIAASAGARTGDERGRSRRPDSQEPFADSPVIGPRGLRTHQRVLDAALEAFAESGYDRTTLDRIAELAGCSRVTIYQYASGKDDLFRRLATQAAAQMWAAFEALEDVTPDASGHASVAGLHLTPRRHRGSLRADHPGVRGSGGDRPLPGGRSGLHHPTSGRPLRSPARRRPISPRGCSTRPSSSSTPA